jgi:hypothetical protein
MLTENFAVGVTQNLPPAVTKLANHPMTTDDDCPQDRYDNMGKIMTMAKQ